MITIKKVINNIAKKINIITKISITTLWVKININTKSFPMKKGILIVVILTRLNIEKLKKIIGIP